MKRVKATAALIYRTETGEHTVEPHRIVDLDDDVADSFIASGAAILVAIEVSDVAEEVTPEALVDEGEAPVSPKFGKRR